MYYSIDESVCGPYFVCHFKEGVSLRSVWIEHGDVLSNTAIISALAEALGRSSDYEARDWPIKLSEALHSELQKTEGSVLFAASCLSKDTISVCNAGDIRVILVSASGEMEATQDHVVAHDPNIPEPKESTNLTPTCYLGGNCSRNPDAHLWTASGDYTLFVCDSRIHHYLDSNSVVERLLSQGITEFEKSQGLFTQIHCSQL